ncbi:MAG: type II toxin-antitoxin system HicA family toxin [Alphaproteobacteria bacterium]|nr:type II toxin-antitoxin system HicA family toxin [Alphaproteobacteria bacterium]
MSARKTFEKLRSGNRNIAFRDLLGLAEAFGFSVVRISGSHHILKHSSLPEMLNFQAVRGDAKPYQVRQLLQLVERYGLKLDREGSA